MYFCFIKKAIHAQEAWGTLALKICRGGGREKGKDIQGDSLT